MTKASEGIGYLIPSKGIATLELERVSELVKHEIKSLRASLFLRARLLQRFVHVWRPHGISAIYEMVTFAGLEENFFIRQFKYLDGEAITIFSQIPSD